MKDYLILSIVQEYYSYNSTITHEKLNESDALKIASDETKYVYEKINIKENDIENLPINGKHSFVKDDILYVKVLNKNDNKIRKFTDPYIENYILVNFGMSRIKNSYTQTFKDIEQRDVEVYINEDIPLYTKSEIPEGYKSEGIFVEEIKPKEVLYKMEEDDTYTYDNENGEFCKKTLYRRVKI